MEAYTPPEPENDCNRMAIIYLNNELSSENPFRELLQCSKDKRNPILFRFLEEATCAIRDELRQAPVALRELVPPFETILDFSEFCDLRRGRPCEAIDGALLCAVELGVLIRHEIFHSYSSYSF